MKHWTPSALERPLDHVHRKGRREGPGVPGRPERRHPDLRPARRRARRRLLRLPVRARVRHAARRRRGLRGPRPAHPRRPPEPARTSAARSSTTSRACRAPASRSTTRTSSRPAAAAPPSAWRRRKRSPPSEAAAPLGAGVALAGRARLGWLAGCGGKDAPAPRRAAEATADRRRPPRRRRRASAARRAARDPREARGRHQRAEPELHLRPARRSRSRSRAGATAREEQPGAVPARHLLAVDPAERERARRPRCDQRRLHARQAAVRGLRRDRATSCARSPPGSARAAEGLVVITGTPEWAARPPSGCERRRIGPTNRMPRSDAMPAYERLVRGMLALARKEGATLRYWAPWNEPNHPYSSSPSARTAPAAADRLPWAVRRGRRRAPQARSPRRPATSATSSARSR